jgi:tetrathionate reductase subunit B
MSGSCGGRRDFIKSILAAVTLPLAPGLVLIAQAEARPPGQAAQAGQRWGLLIDTSRCPADCNKCVEACRVEQGWGDHGLGAADPQWIRKVEASNPQTGAIASLPVMCQHCAQPPCVDVCPTGASFQRVDGIVLVDRHLCIGCRYCMMACPYKARSFVPAPLHDQKTHSPRGEGTVEACTFCVQRIDAGRQPACVEACRAADGAMIFGDLNDPESAIAQALRRFPSTQLRPDLTLGNAVHYQAL